MHSLNLLLILALELSSSSSDSEDLAYNPTKRELKETVLWTREQTKQDKFKFKFKYQVQAHKHAFIEFAPDTCA